jgi:hypothetical protein
MAIVPSTQVVIPVDILSLSCEAASASGIMPDQDMKPSARLSHYGG